jgi:hypothetical protein
MEMQERLASRRAFLLLRSDKFMGVTFLFARKEK